MVKNVSRTPLVDGHNAIWTDLDVVSYSILSYPRSNMYKYPIIGYAKSPPSAKNAPPLNSAILQHSYLFFFVCHTMELVSIHPR